MNNEKNYYYSISWTQNYDSWPSSQWIDTAEQEILESKLDSENFEQAKEIIQRIMNL